MNNDFDEIDTLLLETLSFFEPMSKEMIILDFNEDRLKQLDDFDLNQLEERLEKLIKQKQLKRLKKDKEVLYQKIMPKKSWWKRLFSR